MDTPGFTSSHMFSNVCAWDIWFVCEGMIIANIGVEEITINNFDYLRYFYWGAAGGSAKHFVTIF